MDQVRIASFEEHTTFKNICIFMDELENPLIADSLFKKMKMIMQNETVLETFKKKLSPELKAKVIPKHVQFC